MELAGAVHFLVATRVDYAMPIARQDVHEVGGSVLERMLFATVGWMNRYQGLSGGDSILNGGSFIKEYGYGHEIFNFLPFKGRMYGYVEPPGNSARIGIERLGADEEDEWADDVLVVWISRHQKGGVYIVGWYSHARVHREWQENPGDRRRHHDGGQMGFNVAANESDCVWLSPDQRTFRIPHGPIFVHRNLWYADEPEHQDFRKDVLRYIKSGAVLAEKAPRGGGVAHDTRRPDPFVRVEIERRAVEATVAHYELLGYAVHSVEQDNVGWDLEAVQGSRKLLLEVKGLWGDAINVELTPNEYAKMLQHQSDYRVCVVTSALSRPSLSVFACSPDNGLWETSSGSRLRIEEIVRKSARLRGDKEGSR